MIGNGSVQQGVTMSDMTDSGSDGGRVQDATKAEEEREAAATHTADRSPTAEEDAAAERNRLDPEVTEHEREMGRIGAEVKGEGRID
jgi:hypothetical protein